MTHDHFRVLIALPPEPDRVRRIDAAHPQVPPRQHPRLAAAARRAGRAIASDGEFRHSRAQRQTGQIILICAAAANDRQSLTSRSGG